MEKNLPQSPIDRQNILNNQFALREIRKALDIRGVEFEGDFWVLKEQIADFFEVSTRTIERYLENYSAELSENGYVILKGKRLNNFKLALREHNVSDIDVGDKSPQLGILNFRAFTNIAMILTESVRARLFRRMILDIVIDTINQRSGGSTKYINQRDEDFIIAYFQEENYRKEFTDALRDYVNMGNFKYPNYTNKIYVSIFRENAEEYRKILKLKSKDKVRDTFYSEIIDLIVFY